MCVGGGGGGSCFGEGRQVGSRWHEGDANKQCIPGVAGGPERVTARGGRARDRRLLVVQILM